MLAKYFLKMGVSGKTLIWKHILSKFVIRITCKNNQYQEKGVPKTLQKTS